MTFGQLFNRWTVLGALGVATMLCVLFAFWVWWTQPPAPAPFAPSSANLTLIPAPTATPTTAPTPTPHAAQQPTPVRSGIAVGGYVQITGTDGQGLRIRSGPGLSSAPLFLGFDTEAFEVRDGPEMVDGFTWWYIVAPFDQARAGWAASAYLATIPPPQR
jgi:hypothetical protein